MALGGMEHAELELDFHFTPFSKIKRIPQQHLRQNTIQTLNLKMKVDRQFLYQSQKLQKTSYSLYN